MFKFIQSTYLNGFRHTTSEIGMKAAAIKCGKIDYLNNFGLEYSIKSQFENAEKYLAAVLHETLTNSHMNNALIKACKSLSELAPTSSSIEGHLSSCYYVAYNSLNVLKVTQNC